MCGKLLIYGIIYFFDYMIQTETHTAFSSAPELEFLTPEVLPKAESQEVIDELEGVLQRIPRNKEDHRLTQAETKARKDVPKTRYALGSLMTILGYIDDATRLLKQYHWDISRFEKKRQEIFQGFMNAQSDGTEQSIPGINNITERKNALAQELLKRIPDSLVEEIGCEKVFLLGMIIQMDVQRAAKSMAKKRGLIIESGSEDEAQLQEEAKQKFLNLHQEYRKQLEDRKTGGMVSDGLVDAVEQLITSVIKEVRSAMELSG